MALVLVLAYMVTRLAWLTKLPVFADEAIYIRWAQVGQNEPDKYLFLSMLDGKPPLHNWLIVPFIKIFSDPLFASRFLSAVCGAATAYLIYRIIKLQTNQVRLAQIGVAVSLVMPYFFLNQRMGLAESLLMLTFAAGFYTAIRAFRQPSVSWTLLFAVCFGSALWTKTTALFFMPVYALLPGYLYSLTNGSSGSLGRFYWSKNTYRLVVGGFIGGLLFLTLKLSPLFSFLFTRSRDYSFSVGELLSGQWQHVLFTSLPRVGGWLIWYLTPFCLLLAGYERKTNGWLIAMAAAFALPLVTFGRIISARYFFPVAFLVVLMVVNGFKAAGQNRLDALVAKGLLLTFLVWGLVFWGISAVTPDSTWYVSDDRRQYLEDWSSGHGIPEVRDFIKTRLKDHQITVATEGYFGTLPDGLMMYFARSPEIANLELYGIGQPIVSIPADLPVKALDREVYVVVNSHRYSVAQLPYIQKVGEYKRLHGAPSLLLLKINPQ